METKNAKMKGEDFRALISKLRDSVSTSLQYKGSTGSMIELWFTDGIVTGYACNGYELVTCKGVCGFSDTFIAYICVPRFLPKSTDDVLISADYDDGKLVKTSISFNEATLTYQAPAEGKPLDLYVEALLNDCRGEERAYVAVNALYLDLSTLAVGTRFFVCNGCWWGEIVEMDDGGKGIGLPTPTGNPKYYKILPLYPEGSDQNIEALSDIHFPEDPTVGRKTIDLADGKYTIVYDVSGSFPMECLRYGKPWRKLTGDNLIYWLCTELGKAKGLSEKPED